MFKIVMSKPTHSKVSIVEKFWYSNTVFSNRVIRYFFWVLALPFLFLTFLKRFLYKNNFFKVNQFSVPVIVVGNISVGGTGKTPFITFLAAELKARQLRVGIVSRGYRSNAGFYPHVVSENDSVEKVGDEAYMQYAITKLPMVIGSDRSLAVNQLVAHFKVDVVISDDGLQHYPMGRQYEVVMVDAKRMFGNELILPFGPLRESVNRLKTIDYIIQNGSAFQNGSDFQNANDFQNASVLQDGCTQKKSTVSKRLSRLNQHCSVIEIQVVGLVHILSGDKIALTQLKQDTLNAVCGIGNPERFFSSLSDYCDGMFKYVFPDHHQFSLNDFKPLDDKVVVMTEKDAVKCRKFAQPHWYYLKIAVKMRTEDSQMLLNDIQQKLFNQ